jgi:carbon-monoxide dehydrogenase small subunit
MTVNGTAYDLTVDPRRHLADVLRREIGATGVTVGCETGHCGSCTVLLDGVPVRSCLVLAVQADGAVVETVESLAADGEPAALQQAFSSAGALQCGFCTPGMLMLATGLLRTTPDADRAQIRECVAANLCRCTGYGPIVDAVEAAGSGARS